ncbi:MAG: hypothetical protein PWR22_975 [Moorella sp. (in: firmicutes)]|nr:hypothetical protein [Moorella sp. (in: firmicutes)]
MSIERNFDIAFVADLALHEKQIQQNYRPIIAVHKWFARRPGTLFRSLLLAEFTQGNLADNYYRSHNFQGLRVADPFMGGGTPLIEANRLGCHVLGYDINPMAYWIVRQEIEYLDLEAYQRAARDVGSFLDEQVGSFYRTRCTICGYEDAPVKYFLWVKVQSCQYCGREFDLFPGYILAQKGRHTKEVILCAACGELNEVEDKKHPGLCQHCGAKLVTKGAASRSQCLCSHCGAKNRYPDADSGPPRHRMVAIEYYCPYCKPRHQGRFFKKPDEQDLAKFQAAAVLWKAIRPQFVPEDEIPDGDETDRLHRWGYRYYRELFNERQLLGLELLARKISQHPDERIRNALATNLSDLLRYQNMLCRYDPYALKSLDIFSVHGFPVGLIQCESNLLGIAGGKVGVNIGSGGWANIVDKYVKAKRYCQWPFEIKHVNGRKRQVWLKGEWIGEGCRGMAEQREVDLRCASATRAVLAPRSLDAVLTDPPYFANVQYAELMDFCYVWLRRLVGAGNPAFTARTTRNPEELTGNNTMARGIDTFTEGLSRVFTNMAAALKPGAPFVFTYHHNRLEAYYPVAVALLDAGLVCTVTLPCPAEMAASIHINGTASSIIDTVFVCRTTGVISRRLLVREPEKIATLIIRELEELEKGGVSVTRGDTRCIIYGHLIRLAVWYLRASWDKSLSWDKKFVLIARMIDELGGATAIETYLEENGVQLKTKREAVVCESESEYGAGRDEVSF